MAASPPHRDGATSLPSSLVHPSPSYHQPDRPPRAPSRSSHKTPITSTTGPSMPMPPTPLSPPSSSSTLSHSSPLTPPPLPTTAPPPTPPALTMLQRPTAGSPFSEWEAYIVSQTRKWDENRLVAQNRSSLNGRVTWADQMPNSPGSLTVAALPPTPGGGGGGSTKMPGYVKARHLHDPAVAATGGDGRTPELNSRKSFETARQASHKLAAATTTTATTGTAGGGGGSPAMPSWQATSPLRKPKLVNPKPRRSSISFDTQPSFRIQAGDSFLPGGGSISGSRFGATSSSSSSNDDRAQGRLIDYGATARRNRRNSIHSISTLNETNDDDDDDDDDEREARFDHLLSRPSWSTWTPGRGGHLDVPILQHPFNSSIGRLATSTELHGGGSTNPQPLFVSGAEVRRASSSNSSSAMSDVRVAGSTTTTSRPAFLEQYGLEPDSGESEDESATHRTVTTTTSAVASSSAEVDEDEMAGLAADSDTDVTTPRLDDDFPHDDEEEEKEEDGGEGMDGDGRIASSYVAPAAGENDSLWRRNTFGISYTASEQGEGGGAGGGAAPPLPSPQVQQQPPQHQPMQHEQRRGSADRASRHSLVPSLSSRHTSTHDHDLGATSLQEEEEEEAQRRYEVNSASKHSLVRSMSSSRASIGTGSVRSTTTSDERDRVNRSSSSSSLFAARDPFTTSSTTSLGSGSNVSPLSPGSVSSHKPASSIGNGGGNGNGSSKTKRKPRLNKLASTSSILRSMPTGEMKPQVAASSSSLGHASSSTTTTTKRTERKASISSSTSVGGGSIASNKSRRSRRGFLIDQSKHEETVPPLPTLVLPSSSRVRASGISPLLREEEEAEGETVRDNDNDEHEDGGANSNEAGIAEAETTDDESLLSTSSSRSDRSRSKVGGQLLFPVPPAHLDTRSSSSSLARRAARSAAETVTLATLRSSSTPPPDAAAESAKQADKERRTAPDVAAAESEEQREWDILQIERYLRSVSIYMDVDTAVTLLRRGELHEVLNPTSLSPSPSPSKREEKEEKAGLNDPTSSLLILKDSLERLYTVNLPPSLSSSYHFLSRLRNWSNPLLTSISMGVYAVCWWKGVLLSLLFSFFLVVVVLGGKVSPSVLTMRKEDRLREDTMQMRRRMEEVEEVERCLLSGLAIEVDPSSPTSTPTPRGKKEVETSLPHLLSSLANATSNLSSELERLHRLLSWSSPLSSFSIVVILTFLAVTCALLPAATLGKLVGAGVGVILFTPPPPSPPQHAGRGRGRSYLLPLPLRLPDDREYARDVLLRRVEKVG